MNGRRVYLRLIEKVESDAPLEARLQGVREALLRHGLEIESRPSVHLRGGFDVAVTVPVEDDWKIEAFFANEGYLFVI